MARVTQNLKTSMSVLAGGNVPAYTLEYLTPTGKKAAGDFETIIIPYIELGRANNCVIRFTNAETTISRIHAAIERRESGYFLIHESLTNPSLVNGQSISREIALKSGDEIQLSVEGPKLRFTTSSTGTSNMGLTKRVNLLIKQSTRQYRSATYSILGVLLLVCIIGGWFIYSQHTELKEIRIANEELIQQRKQDSISYLQASIKNATVINELILGNKTLEQKSLAHEEEIKRLIDETELDGNKIYELIKDNIYFLELKEIFITKPNGESGAFNMSWTGTAFLCEDGKLVTARHCIQGWRFGKDEKSNFINLCELNGGRVSARYRVTSSKDWFEFEYRDVILNDSEDISQKINIPLGNGNSTNYVLKFSNSYSTDWAYVQTNRTSSITYDKTLSTSLNAGEKLYILGFSFGEGAPMHGAVNPLYSESSVAQSGISESGLILITNRNFEQGNSGGPVFVKSGKKIQCIGIVSNATINPSTGETSSIGGIVPVQNIQITGMAQVSEQ